MGINLAQMPTAKYTISTMHLERLSFIHDSPLVEGSVPHLGTGEAT